MVEMDVVRGGGIGRVQGRATQGAICDPPCDEPAVYSWEIQLMTHLGTHTSLGVGTEDMPQSDHGCLHLVGGNQHSWGMALSMGHPMANGRAQLMHNGQTLMVVAGAYGRSVGQGDTIGMALDTTKGTLTFSHKSTATAIWTPMRSDVGEPAVITDERLKIGGAGAKPVSIAVASTFSGWQMKLGACSVRGVAGRGATVTAEQAGELAKQAKRRARRCFARQQRRSCREQAYRAAGRRVLRRAWLGIEDSENGGKLEGSDDDGEECKESERAVDDGTPLDSFEDDDEIDEQDEDQDDVEDTGGEEDKDSDLDGPERDASEMAAAAVRKLSRRAETASAAALGVAFEILAAGDQVLLAVKVLVNSVLIVCQQLIKRFVFLVMFGHIHTCANLLRQPSAP